MRMILLPRYLPALLVVAGLLLGPPTLARAAEVTQLVRPAELQRGGEGPWAAVEPGMTVHQGDRIRTGRGARVEVTLREGQLFRVGPNTEVTVTHLADASTEGLAGRVRVAVGKLWSAFWYPVRVERRAEFLVDLPTATAGIKGTQFSAEYSGEAGDARVLVLEGEVLTRAPPAPPREVGPPQRVEGPRQVPGPQEVPYAEWREIVAADHKLVLGPQGGRRVERLTEADRANPWIAANLARDAELRQGPPTPAPAPQEQPGPQAE